MITAGIVQGFYGIDEQNRGGVDLGFETGLSSLTYSESLDGSASFSLRCIISDWSVWDSILRDGSQRSKIRWGITNENRVVWSDWRFVTFLSGKYIYNRQFAESFAAGADWGYMLNETFSSRSFSGQLISDIVEKIAEDHRFSHEVEKTSGRFTLYQTSLSDAEFIKFLCLPRAESVKKRTDYDFWFRNGEVLVFKPFVLGQTPRVTFSFRLSGANQPLVSADTEEIVVEFNRMFLPENFGWNTVVDGFDPVYKRPLRFVANDDTVYHTKLAPVSPRIDQSRKWKKTSVIEPTAEEYDRENFFRMAKCKWSRNERKRFLLTIKSTPVIDIHPGELALLEVKDASGVDHYLGGVYLIYGVKQVVKRGELSTYLYLERRESR
jgi:hypothetical protein